MVYDGKAVKAVELVSETVFGTFPTDPTMLGLGGYVKPATIKTSIITEKIPFLKGVDDTNRLQSTHTQKVSEAYAATFEMKPIDWSILPYVLCAATPTTYAIGDTIHNVGLGIRVGDDYQTAVGGIINSYACTLEPDVTAVATVGAMFADVSAPTPTDYIGGGSHAASVTGNALTFEALTGILYDAALPSVAGMKINSIGFGVEYSKTDAVKDVEAITPGNVGAWALGQRNINLTLNTTVEDVDVVGELVGGAAHTFEFAGAGKTLTFSNIIWEGDWDMALDADDVIGMPLTATNVDLAIA